MFDGVFRDSLKTDKRKTELNPFVTGVETRFKSGAQYSSAKLTEATEREVCSQIIQGTPQKPINTNYSVSTTLIVLDGCVAALAFAVFFTRSIQNLIAKIKLSYYIGD